MARRVCEEALGETPIFNFVTQNQNVFNGNVCMGHKGGWKVKGGL